jgi:hypothetical protein
MPKSVQIETIDMEVRTLIARRNRPARAVPFDRLSRHVELWVKRPHMARAYHLFIYARLPKTSAVTASEAQ